MTLHRALGEVFAPLADNEAPRRFFELREFADDLGATFGDYNDFVAEQIRDMLADLLDGYRLVVS